MILCYENISLLEVSTSTLLIFVAAPKLTKTSSEQSPPRRSKSHSQNKKASFGGNAYKVPAPKKSLQIPNPPLAPWAAMDKKRGGGGGELYNFIICKKGVYVCIG
jgi:hypothetical protein